MQLDSASMYNSTGGRGGGGDKGLPAAMLLKLEP